jgi:hypothetical protein
MASDNGDDDPWADWDDYSFEPSEIERHQMRRVRRKFDERVNRVALIASRLLVNAPSMHADFVKAAVAMANEIFAEAERTVVVK